MNLSSPLNHLTIFRTTTRSRWDPWTPLALVPLSLFGVAFIYSAQLSVQGKGEPIRLVLVRGQWRLGNGES